MSTVTEEIAISQVKRELEKLDCDRKIKDIFAEPQRRNSSAHATAAKWKVFVVFDKQNEFLQSSMVFLVAEDGMVEILERM